MHTPRDMFTRICWLIGGRKNFPQIGLQSSVPFSSKKSSEHMSPLPEEFWWERLTIIGNSKMEVLSREEVKAV